MRVKKLHLFLLTLALLLLTLVATPVFAIVDPDKIELKQVSAFRNFAEANDLLFLIEYNIEYAVIPTEDPRLAYSVEIANTSTGSSYGNRPVLYYGHAYQALYWTAAKATASGLTWDMANLQAVVTANPVIFPVVTLGGNRQESNITSGDTLIWLDGTLEGTTPTLVGDKILEITENASIAVGQSYTQITNLGDKLSTSGGVIAMKVLPGIRTIVPDIFAFTSSLTDEPVKVYGNAGQTFLEGNQPAAFSTSLDSLGETLFGSPGKGMIIGGIGFLLIAISILGMMFNVTQATTPAMVAGIPLILAGSMLGIIPIGLVFAAFFFVLVLFGITFLMSRMA